MTARSVAFTASRTLSPQAASGIVTSVLTVHVPHADRYVTGACTGGDAFIGKWLYCSRPEAEHVVVVPADRSRVEEWWAGLGDVTAIEMPPGTSYGRRNARLVVEADAVFAFPAYPEDDIRSLRSGTWQTVRQARKAGNFSMWHMVTPPYAGMIEVRPAELLGGDAGDDPGCE